MTDAAVAVTQEELAQLARFLESDFGLRFTAASSDLIEGGLHAVAQELQLPVAVLLRALLHGDAALLHRLAGRATIHETYFFRHPEHFEALVAQVVPELLQRGRTTLRAWSAGCATGEEAYSLAATLHAAAPGVAVSVLGTDLSESALAAAAHGQYSRRSLRSELPRWSLGCPLQVGPSSIEVPIELRQLLRFQPLNLHQPSYPEDLFPESSFDIIFCRNVLVYFSPAAAAQVMLRLRDRLREGGYLFLAALDYTAPVPGMSLVRIGGVLALRRDHAVGKAPVESDRRSYARPEPDLIIAQEWPTLSGRTAVGTPARDVAAILRERAQRLAQRERADEPRHSEPLVIFAIGGHHFGLPLGDVVYAARLQQLTPIPQAARHYLGLTWSGGYLVTVLDVAVLLGLREGGRRDATACVVTSRGSRQLGFGAAVLLGIEDVPAAQISPLLTSDLSASLDLQAAAAPRVAFLGNERALLLDLGQLLARLDRGESAEPAR